MQVRTLLGRGIVTGGDADELMTGLMKLFGAQSAAFAQGFTFASWNAALDVPMSWLALHGRYERQDPSRARLANTTGETYLIDRDSSQSEKECDLYFHLRDQGYRDGLIATLYNPFIADLAMVLYRAEGARPFSATDEEVFRTLYPHLAAGLAARRALAAMQESPRETLPHVLGRLDGHVYLSLPSGTVTWSDAARALWTDALGLTGDAGWARAERVLLASARQFYSPFAGGRSQLILPGLRIEWAALPPRRTEQRRMVG